MEEIKYLVGVDGDPVAAAIDNWADLCPICEYPFEHCQCRYGGSAHPDRSDRARVIFDHLYLLTAGQLDHVMHVQSFWQTSYADEKRNKILLNLIHQAKRNCGLDKPFLNSVRQRSGMKFKGGSMEEKKYFVEMGGHRVAENMSIQTALALIDGLFAKYDKGILISVRRMDWDEPEREET